MCTYVLQALLLLLLIFIKYILLLTLNNRIRSYTIRVSNQWACRDFIYFFYNWPAKKTKQKYYLINYWYNIIITSDATVWIIKPIVKYKLNYLLTTYLSVLIASTYLFIVLIVYMYLFMNTFTSLAVITKKRAITNHKHTSYSSLQNRKYNAFIVLINSTFIILRLFFLYFPFNTKFFFFIQYDWYITWNAF